MKKGGKATTPLLLQLRLRATVMAFFGLSLILLWIVKLNSCASFQFSWLGLTPMQVYIYICLSDYGLLPAN